METPREVEPKHKAGFRAYLEQEFGVVDRQKQDLAIAIFDETFFEKAREAGILPAELSAPLYQMILNKDEHWLPIREAGIAYDSGWIPVRIGGLVMEGVGQRRPITDQERYRISEIADDYSASK